MFSALRTCLAVVTMAGLLGPSLATVCAQEAERHCQASEHACCNGPRLTKCDCRDTHGAVQAEPAQRATKLTSDGPVIAITAEPLAEPGLSHRSFRLHDPAPPPPTRERLSLLAILVV